MNRPVALVTGASRGIGRKIAEALSPTHHVLVGGRDAAAVAEVVASLDSAEPFVVDLTDEVGLGAAVAGIDRVDVLVHSAGLVAFGPLADSSTAEWRSLLELNVIAPAALTRLLLPALRAANGLVVFINSGAGLTANKGFSLYSASKFALTALADSLRAEEHGRVRSPHCIPDGWPPTCRLSWPRWKAASTARRYISTPRPSPTRFASPWTYRTLRSTPSGSTRPEQAGTVPSRSGFPQGEAHLDLSDRRGSRWTVIAPDRGPTRTRAWPYPLHRR